ncbi:MAG: prolipoprotein diacylglyceryl transferase [Alphaproteobacteria bacterium]|nr:prolipoprotein diacylglyceryl transferase [Alphaproteobacteria bacterium]
MQLEIPFPKIDPAAFTIPIPEFALGPLAFGPFPIRWYALGYIGGVLIGWWYANRIASRPRLWGDPAKMPLTRADIDDFAFWVMIGILVGGRIGYILFYTLPFEPEKVANDPAFIFKMWEGGMSFHGGLIGAALAVLYTTWSRKISLLSLGDVACASAPIGIFLVRIANFINGELYGRETTAPWAMRFPTYNWNTREWVYSGSEALVHPSQLYEAALEGALLFIVLAVAVWGFRALRKPGLVSGIFLIGYAAFRTFVENFREPDSFVAGLPPPLTMGMLLSIPMVIGGVWLIVRAQRTPQPA